MEVKPEVQITFESTELGHLCSAVLRTVEGKALIEMLKEMFMYRSPFVAGNHLPYGTVENYLFVVQGNANLIRLIEQQAKAYQEQKK